MKVYIWQNLSGLTSNYHDSGGFVITAESDEKALELFKAHSHRDVWEKPDKVIDSEQPENNYFIFPDAGCC